MNEKDLKNVPHPICPINMYFEGDEDKFDASKCDFEDRMCTQACEEEKEREAKKSPLRKVAEDIMKDRKRGSNSALISEYGSPDPDEKELLKVCKALLQHCPCHSGGFGEEGVMAQPCDICDNARSVIEKFED